MRRINKNWRRNFIYNDNGIFFYRMSIQSTSIEDVKNINQSLMSLLHPSSVNIICHPIVNTDGSINIASNILSKCWQYSKY